MSVWDLYADKVNKSGSTRREASLIREKRLLTNRDNESLSYQTVKVFTCDNTINISTQESQDKAFDQDVVIINSDNLNEKVLLTLPDEDMELGSIIFWDDNHWIVAEKDANTTVYTKTKLLQCNHLLRWISGESVIEQWCVIEDGTKYLTGELEDRQFIVTRGDSRIAMTITRNDETKNFGRSMRFLIDDPESPHKLSYQLTKPLKLYGVYNNKGVYKFVLQEVSATEYDNHDLGIADYYKLFPKEEPPEHNEIVPGTNKRMWI